METEHWDLESDGAETRLRDELAARGYAVTRYTYPPGTVFPPHTHDVDKIDVVLSGRFRLTMGSESAILEAGDGVRVPRGARHAAEVVGDEQVVSLDAVRRA